MTIFKTYEGFFDFFKKKERIVPETPLQKRYYDKIENFLNTEDSENIKNVFDQEEFNINSIRFYISFKDKNNPWAKDCWTFELPSKFGSIVNKYDPISEVIFKPPTGDPRIDIIGVYSEEKWNGEKFNIVEYIRSKKIENIKFIIRPNINVLSNEILSGPKIKRLSDISEIIQSVCDLGEFKIEYAINRLDHRRIMSRLRRNRNFNFETKMDYTITFNF